MRFIKTTEDISLLRQAGALSHVLLNEIERQLTTVYENVNDGADIEEFSLRDIGPIVVLEPGDNVRDLEEIGLNPEDGGLLGAAPEWVELMEREGQKFYSMVIVLNNEYAINIYCPPYATLMLQYGVSSKIASSRLGHSSIAITLDLYSHVLPDMQREVSAKIDEGLFRKLNIQESFA